ncbi:MAG: hypothetical protein AAF630_17585 [Cyanobacteria bacterium P01_C01_bin.38]
MISPQWLKFLKSLGIEFWLPLPLLGLSFWFVGGWLTEKTLTSSRNNDAVNLQATQPDYDYGVSIKVKFFPSKGYSLVRIEKLSKTYTESRMVLKTTKIPLIEAAIAAETGMSREKVRKIMRYR